MDIAENAGHFPKSQQLAATLIVFDAANCSEGEKLLLVSLQGLVNRTCPSLYIVWFPEERLWIDWYREQGYIQAFHEVESLGSLLDVYGKTDFVLVQTDPTIARSLNVAQMVASIEDGLIFTPDSEFLIGLTKRWSVVADFRDRFSTNVEAYRWAYEHLWDKLNHDLCAMKYATSIADRDYAVSNKLFTFWISGEKDGQMDGASQEHEIAFAKMLFERLPPNRPIIGYPYAGEGIGPGEGGGVSLATEYAKFIACDCPNLTVHSGVRLPELKQRRDIRMTCPEYDKGKIYISFVISDGDNMNCWDTAHLPLWRQAARGEVPIAWNVMPGLYDLMPGIMAYYYATAGERDEFIVAGSGIGYANPYRYGNELQQGEGDHSIFRQYIADTGEYMRRMDLDILNPYHLGYRIDHQNVPAFKALDHQMPSAKKLLSEYKQILPGLKGFFPDYARTPGMTFEQAHYFIEDTPVFHALSSHFWPSEGVRKDLEKKVGELRKAVGNTRPAFLHVFMVNWCFGPNDLRTFCNMLGDDYIPVLPSHLIQLAGSIRE